MLHIDETQSRDNWPHVSFREGATERQAHVLGTGLRVWQLVKAFRAMNEDVEATAKYFEIDPELVVEAVSYARCHPEEIEALIHRHEKFHAEEVLISGDQGRLPESPTTSS